MNHADTIRAAVEALEAIMGHPDVRSYLGSIISNKADSTLSLLRSAIEQGEPTNTAKRAHFDKFLRCWEYGGALRMPDIWEAYQAGWLDALASIPPITPVEAGKVGDAADVKGPDDAQR